MNKILFQKIPIVSQIPSILSGDKAQVYRFCSLKDYCIARVHPRSHARAMTLSFYAKASKGSEKIRVSMRSPLCSQTKDFNVSSDQWTRCIVTVRNDISLDPLDVYISLQLAVKLYSDIAIALPQIEQGAWASSPISHDIPLPIGEIPHNAKCATRTADRISVKENVYTINSEVGTVVFQGKPTPKTEEILDCNFISFLSFWSEEEQTEISFGISGARDYSRFVVREFRNKKYAYTETQVIGGNQEYFLCIVFDRNILSVILNGAIIAVHKIIRASTFKVYIGCSHTSIEDNFNGLISQIMFYELPLLYLNILELYRKICPNAPDHAYNYMSRYYKQSIISKSAQDIIDESIKKDGFNYFLSQLKFAVPKIYEQFSQKKEFVEEDVRDHLCALMDGPNRRIDRESYSHIGRTDIALDYMDVSNAISKYRIELKIWGREGYKETPSQPLKYMMEAERVAAFIMIDRRKDPNVDDFINNVRNNSEYPCIAVSDYPILDIDIKYFLSFHSDARYKTPRMIINFFITLPKVEK